MPKITSLFPLKVARAPKRLAREFQRYLNRDSFEHPRNRTTFPLLDLFQRGKVEVAQRFALKSQRPSSSKNNHFIISFSRFEDSLYSQTKTHLSSRHSLSLLVRCQFSARCHFWFVFVRKCERHDIWVRLWSYNGL
jgi:hypothetical protein